MKTNIQTTTTQNLHAQTTRKASKGKCGLAMALILLSGTQLAISADITSAPVPQRQHTLPNNLTLPTPPRIPSLEDYDACLSKAMDIIGSGDCNTTSNIIFCIKAKFVENSDSCALYL